MAFLQNILKPSSFSRILTSATPIASTVFNTQNEIFTTQKRFAARKGKRIAATREKQKLARARKEEAKKAPPKVWRPKKFLADKGLGFVSKKFNDEDRRDLSEIVDNVYIIDQYKERRFSFEDVLSMVRETHDPTIYDEPNALIEAKFELDLRTKKKTKFVEKFQGVASFNNQFKYTLKRKVIAICKTEEEQEIAKDAGAEMAGGSDLISMLKAGELTMDNFDELVCHSDMLVELAVVRKILGNFYPTLSRGNLGEEIGTMVKHFVNGLEYKMVKDLAEPDYGSIHLPFGRLDLSNEQLKENFERCIETVDRHKPGDVKYDFITRVLINSDPCMEKFPVAYSPPSV